MPTLLEALERKYFTECQFAGQQDAAVDTAVATVATVTGGAALDGRLISIFIPRMSPLSLVPELLVLNDCDIDRAGDFERIKDKCQRVRELDLAQNKLSDWQEVFDIVEHMPRIEFLNLSKNQLMGPITKQLCAPTIANLRGIVLNGTYLDWPCVDVLLRHLPRLEELHLSLNNYHEVRIDVDADADAPQDNLCCHANANNCCPTNTSTATDALNSNEEETPPPQQQPEAAACQRCTPHRALKTLHFTGNPIESWCEICRLGRVFPSLENLVLADCPIRAIDAAASSVAEHSEQEAQAAPPPAQPYEHFHNLLLLNLSCAHINTWNDIDQLARFPKLRNLRVKKWPLWERLECTEHERRQLLVARLPNVSSLNGGLISADEREDAERAFVRHYMDKPECERPARYAELLAKHGQLDPLVDVSLKPDKRVKVLLSFQEHTEPRLVDIYITVADLKTRLEKVLGLPANKMRLYYVDQDYREFGPEEMRFPNKMLYSYNIQAGDEIIVDEKK